MSYILDMGDGTVYEFIYPYEDDCAENGTMNCTFTVQSWNFTSNGTGNGTVYGTTNGKYKLGTAKIVTSIPRMKGNFYSILLLKQCFLFVFFIIWIQELEVLYTACESYYKRYYICEFFILDSGFCCRFPSLQNCKMKVKFLCPWIE